MATTSPDPLQPVRELVGRDLSDAEIARALGIGAPTISHWRTRGLPQAVRCLLPYVNTAATLAESRWAGPIFACLRGLLEERIAQRGETVETIARRAELQASEVRQVIERGRIPLDRAARLCEALDAEICARSTEHDTWEVSEQAAEAWGIAPGPIRARALGRRLLRTTGLEPKPDPIEDALPAQPPPTDHRLVRVLAWIRDWWAVSGPDLRTWLYEDLRRQYPEFQGWLKETASEIRTEEGEVLR